MTFDFITASTTGNVTNITLNRPDVMNAINPQMHAELQSAFDAFAADDNQFLCVIRGAGERAFCAGSDLKSIATGDIAPYPENGYAGLIERFDLNKPVIAAVDGFALGGGFEIALACDIIVATSRSSFGLPEPLVGAVALGGGLHRLARQIGLKQAMGMVLTAERVSAADALTMGFVNEVTALDKFETVLADWCERILRCAPLSIAASKEAIMRGLDESSLASAMSSQDDYPAFHRWKRAEDTVEGPKAFAEKRKPSWQGR
ncbi:MAG: enoyl-CoA hydratase/isomerase family protein [Pseudomonadales bacterium]|nr:enoyl-CoA hydratase/isomerase family protein [Pseudomonadales bacterium]